MGVRLLTAARTAVFSATARSRTLVIVRGLRPRHFLRATLVLAVVVMAADVLLSVPWLRFGWWTAIGGTGNPVTGGTSRAQGTALEWLLPTVFLGLLVPALPLFAEYEERMFRLGAEHRSTSRRVRQGVEFGLVHAVVGIPIGVALALSIGGWYLTWAYLGAARRRGPQAGLAESTRSHLAMNLVVVTLVIATLPFLWT